MVKALKEYWSILIFNWKILLSMKGNFQSLFKLNYFILFLCFDYIPLSFECTDIKTIIVTITSKVLFRLDYYGWLLNKPWCGVYSRVVFNQVNTVLFQLYWVFRNNLNVLYMCGERSGEQESHWPESLHVDIKQWFLVCTWSGRVWNKITNDVEIIGGDTQDSAMIMRKTHWLGVNFNT